MTRPSEITRDRIIKAATQFFAERGYDGANVRAIVARAHVNQAAINYHFAGKAGLYRAVLHAAFEALTKDESLNAEALKALPREEALRRFVRRQLRPLTARDEISRYLQIFNWEASRPTPVFKAFLKEEAAPFLSLAVDLVSRFLPPSASAQKSLIAAIWLLGQCSVFVRNREQLSTLGSPLRMPVDDAFVDDLADIIGAWAIGGLASDAPQRDVEVGRPTGA